MPNGFLIVRFKRNSSWDVCGHVDSKWMYRGFFMGSSWMHNGPMVGSQKVLSHTWIRHVSIVDFERRNQGTCC